MSVNDATGVAAVEREVQPPPPPQKLTTQEFTKLENFGLRAQVLRNKLDEFERAKQDVTLKFAKNLEDAEKFRLELSEKYGVILNPGMIAEDGTILSAPVPPNSKA